MGESRKSGRSYAESRSVSQEQQWRKRNLSSDRCKFSGTPLLPVLQEDLLALLHSRSIRSASYTPVFDWQMVMAKKYRSRLDFVTSRD